MSVYSDADLKTYFLKCISQDTKFYNTKISEWIDHFDPTFNDNQAIKLATTCNNSDAFRSIYSSIQFQTCKTFQTTTNECFAIALQDENKIDLIKIMCENKSLIINDENMKPDYNNLSASIYTKNRPEWNAKKDLYMNMLKAIYESKYH